MTDQIPETPRSGWMPTSSTNTILIGGAIGTLVCSAWNSFIPSHQLGTNETGAILTLCAWLASYIHPDGGRK